MTGNAVAATVAHEIRQPLTAMVTSADAGFRFLDRSMPNLDRAKDAFKRIAADGHRAAAVVESIRTNLRTDVQGRTSLDVNELIQEALALERGDLQKYRILVQADAHQAMPEVRGNRVQLQQVLLNLITNAVDAMAAKDGPRILRVKSEAYDADCVLVSVADTGGGIRAEHVDRIFNPLFTTKSDGIGMGLSICRAMIEAHGGRLWYAPNTPRGRDISIHLARRVILRPPASIGSECGSVLRTPGVRHRYFGCRSHSDQLGERLGAHLLHDVSAMNLQRDLADTQLGRGLLVEKAADD